MRKPSVDVVAFILALTLGLSVVLIVIAVIVQIFVSSSTPVLSQTSANVIDSGITGIIGVLGGYVGYSMKKRDDSTKNPPPGG